MPAEAFANTLILRHGVAGASQSCLVDARAALMPPRRLAELGDGYLRFLGTLPLLALARCFGQACVGPWFAPKRLPLLCFAQPYLAAARGGRELRYPIVRGLMVHTPGGHLALGVASEGGRARIWLDVLAYQPRLGLGPLYLLTQVQLHRLITVAYLRRVVGAAEW